jgi:hypothetical protein
MRMEVYYDDFLRRDFFEKIGDESGEVMGVSLRISCKGLSKVEDVAVVKSLLLLEGITNVKGNRLCGLRRSRFFGRSSFFCFVGGSDIRRRVDMFCFMDKWTSIYSHRFLMEGGKFKVSTDFGVDVVYYNLTDYVEVMPRFSRFRSNIGCKIVVVGGNVDFRSLMIDGFRLV